MSSNAAPCGPVTFGLWEPPLTSARGEAGAPVRRSATSKAATLLADLVAEAVPALAFTRSRRGAEAVALGARRALRESGAARHSHRVAAYRSGYLREDRRALEEALRNGDITGLATTTALELGVDISGLDAVLITGWPGTRAALWQQAGRAGTGQAQRGGGPDHPGPSCSTRTWFIIRMPCCTARSRRRSWIRPTRTCWRRTCARPRRNCRSPTATWPRSRRARRRGRRSRPEGDAPAPQRRPVLDAARPPPQRRAPRIGPPPGQDRGTAHRAAGGHGGRALLAPAGAYRGGLPAPGRAVSGG